MLILKELFLLELIYGRLTKKIAICTHLSTQRGVKVFQIKAVKRLACPLEICEGGWEK